MAWTLAAACLSFADGGQQEVPGEYIVKMKTQSNHAVSGKIQGKAVLKGAFAMKGIYHLSGVSDPAFVESLKNDPEVEYVEPNYYLSSIETLPETGKVDAQTAKYYDQTGAAVQATEAWAASSAYSSTNRPIVAIIDTGLDYNHYVFQQSGALWVNAGEIPNNGVDDDFNGYVDDVKGWNFFSNTANMMDDEGHGTHVAGIVLGATQDILAASLEPAKIRIMPLKFLDANGSGTTAAAVNAIYYAVNMGAKVINCSWGGGSYSRSLHDALIHAYRNSVLVVSAAGNYSSNNDVTAMYPANYDVPSNISVAASTDSDRLASFSNYGISMVHVAAPGSYVYSTVPGNWFSSMSGTSMAAPFVAGTAALAFREAPQISAYQLRELILSTTDPSSYLVGKVSSEGRLNSEQMVLSAKTMISSAAYTPQYSPVYKAERAPSSSSGDSGGGGGGGGCGMIQAVAGGSGGGLGGAGTLAILFGLPMFVWWSMRRAAMSPASQRRFDRYVMKSDLVIKSGDRELVGTLSTISVGGLSFNVDEALEKGGSIQMKVMGPDGKEAIEVEGRIVWSERNKAYGVQFAPAQETVRELIGSWTRKLVKQS